jgi:hypothetical protein
MLTSGFLDRVERLCYIPSFDRGLALAFASPAAVIKRYSGNDALSRKTAKVAELADALDLGSSPARGGGSTPPFRTIIESFGFSLRDHGHRMCYGSW